MGKEELSSIKQDKALWKGVAISLFWMLLVLTSSFIIFEFALRIMSNPNTLCFIVGIVLIAFCILASFGVLYYEISKICKISKKQIKPEEKTEEKKD